MKASRGFEPRLLDSESRVLTVTPRGRRAHNLTIPGLEATLGSAEGATVSVAPEALPFLQRKKAPEAPVSNDSLTTSSALKKNTVSRIPTSLKEVENPPERQKGENGEKGESILKQNIKRFLTFQAFGDFLVDLIIFLH